MRKDHEIERLEWSLVRQEAKIKAAIIEMDLKVKSLFSFKETPSRDLTETHSLVLEESPSNDDYKEISGIELMRAWLSSD